jgi:hypothetical protein
MLLPCLNSQKIELENVEMWINEQANPTLKFCIHCGKKVDKYQYSSIDYGDVYEYGNDVFSLAHYLRNRSGVVTYQCSCHDEELLAPNLCNTGSCCPDCGHFMNLFAEYCGVCSRKLWFGE